MSTNTRTFRFNPCAGISVVVTLRATSPNSPRPCFNPCAGISVVVTLRRVLNVALLCLFQSLCRD